MEDPVDAQLNILVNDEKSNISGLLVTDKQGLCIKTVGNAKEEASGIVTAILDLVAKLEPNKTPPEVILESDTKCCILFSNTNTNAAVFKNVTH